MPKLKTKSSNRKSRVLIFLNGLISISLFYGLLYINQVYNNIHNGFMMFFVIFTVLIISSSVCIFLNGKEGYSSSSSRRANTMDSLISENEGGKNKNV